MTRVRVESFTISLDGYGAGPNQDINNPLGIGGTDLHQWLFPTRTFQRALFEKDGGTTGVDNDFAARGFENVGAWILGRNMFSPPSWAPAGHELERLVGRQSTVSRSGLHHDASCTSTHRDGRRHDVPFVTGGIRDALERARKAAGGMDVRAAVGRTPSSSIFARASLMNCTLLSHPSCSAEENGCSKG